MREIVSILTAGGSVHIDATASAENGLIDVDEDHASGEMTMAVRRAITNGNAMLDTDGNSILVERGVALAFTHRETGVTT